MTSPGCVPGATLHVDLAVERRDRQRHPDRRRRRGDVEHGDEVVAVAQEALVGLHVHEHVEVPGRPAAVAGVPAAAEAHALAVVDPGGDVDAQRASSHLAPAALAALARLFGGPAVAAADVAGHLAHNLAERVRETACSIRRRRSGRR